MIPKLILALVIWFQIFPATVFAEPKIRIKLEKETRKKVNIAIPDFVLAAKYEDPEGLGRESRSILQNDLKLSEHFVLIDQDIYKEIALLEQNRTTVDYASWNEMGAQWLLKTQYKINPLDKSFNVTFRLYDTVTESFLLGVRYTATRKLLRKIIHRFADKIVLQLTGKRGIAETKVAFLSQIEGSKEIYTIDFDGHGLRKITDENSIILTPAW